MGTIQLTVINQVSNGVGAGYEHLVEDMIAFDWGRLWSWDLGLLELSGMRMLTRFIEISILCTLGNSVERTTLSLWTLTETEGILFRLQPQFLISWHLFSIPSLLGFLTLWRHPRLFGSSHGWRTCGPRSVSLRDPMCRSTALWACGIAIQTSTLTLAAPQSGTMCSR